MLREFLLQYMDENIANGVQFLLALLATLLLFGLTVWFLRLLTGGRRRQSHIVQDDRLQVLDRQQVDENRSLLLVRRDGVEHLLMVGGPSDVVVESHINLKDTPDGDEPREPIAGHEIARRVIAQRPLRTMALDKSSPEVAESLGLLNPASEQEALPNEPVAVLTEPKGRPAPQTASPVEPKMQAQPPIEASTSSTKVAISVAPAVIAADTVEPSLSEQEQPDPIVNVAKVDIADFEQALTPAENAAESINAEPTPDANTTKADQDDLAAGLAAALSLDEPAPSSKADLNLESQFADMMEVELMENASSYNGNSAVLSPSESALKGAERPRAVDDAHVKIVDTTRPGRVDDEMSRLLQELASPGRA